MLLFLLIKALSTCTSYTPTLNETVARAIDYVYESCYGATVSFLKLKFKHKTLMANMVNAFIFVQKTWVVSYKKFMAPA